MTRTKTVRLYCACTPDEYEFIIHMADSRPKLARLIGWEPGHVYKAFKRDQGKTHFTRARKYVFRVVDIEEDE